MSEHIKQNSEYIRRKDAIKLVAIVLAAEAQLQGYDVNVSDCISEAAAWVEDYCPGVEDYCPGVESEAAEE